MNDELRILVVTSLWPIDQSHAGRQVETLVDSLNACTSVTVEVVHIRGKSDIKYLRANWVVRRHARRFRPHVILCIYGPSIFACIASRRVPKVVYLLGSDVNLRLRQTATAIAARRATPVFVSESLRVKWPSSNGAVIPNGVDRALFSPGSKPTARKLMGLPSDSPIVMFGAVPSVQSKNYGRFSRVVELVRQRHPDLREVHLTGDNPPKDVANLLRAADVLVLTSDRGTEGSPTIVKEALSCGTPVVTVDVGDVSRWVKMPHGHVVAWDDEERLRAELASKIEEFLGTKQTSPSSRFEFDLELVTNQMLALLKSATKC